MLHALSTQVWISESSPTHVWLGAVKMCGLGRCTGWCIRRHLQMGQPFWPSSEICWHMLTIWSQYWKQYWTLYIALDYQKPQRIGFNWQLTVQYLQLCNGLGAFFLQWRPFKFFFPKLRAIVFHSYFRLVWDVWGICISLSHTRVSNVSVSWVHLYMDIHQSTST